MEKKANALKLQTWVLRGCVKNTEEKFIVFHYLLRKFQIKDPSRGDGYKENVKENVAIYSCGFIFKW